MSSYFQTHLGSDGTKVEKMKASPIEAAARLNALPPGGWGETQQATNQLIDKIVSWRNDGKKVYRLPSGRRTIDGSKAIGAWVEAAQKAGRHTHPDRRSGTTKVEKMTDKLPMSGYAYTSSRKRPKEPETVTLPSNLIGKLKYVGKVTIEGQSMHAWKVPNKARYYFQTHLGSDGTKIEKMVTERNIPKAEVAAWKEGMRYHKGNKRIPICDYCNHKATSHHDHGSGPAECMELACSCDAFEAPPVMS